MPHIPTHMNIEMYRITIDGFTETPLYLSLKDLKNNYKQVEILVQLSLLYFCKRYPMEPWWI